MDLKANDFFISYIRRNGEKIVCSCSLGQAVATLDPSLA